MTVDVLCERLVKLYRVGELDVAALQGLDLNIGAGEMVGLVGPSGSGKSSLLHILSGHLRPSAGQCRVGSTNLATMTERERLRYRRDSVGVVWQDPGTTLVPHLSMVDNVALPIELAGRRLSRRRATDVLATLDMEDFAKARMSELSGGELQRVAVAAAVANRPALLLADEPTSALDPQSASEVYELLRFVQGSYGTTVLIVSHDARIDHEVDRVVELRNGLAASEVRGGPGHENAIASVLLVDDAGRVRLPDEWRHGAGIADRAQADFDGSSIRIGPVEP